VEAARLGKNGEALEEDFSGKHLSSQALKEKFPRATVENTS
jgi:hypothetical protein